MAKDVRKSSGERYGKNVSAILFNEPIRPGDSRRWHINHVERSQLNVAFTVVQDVLQIQFLDDSDFMTIVANQNSVVGLSAGLEATGLKDCRECGQITQQWDDTWLLDLAADVHFQV